MVAQAQGNDLSSVRVQKVRLEIGPARDNALPLVEFNEEDGLVSMSSIPVDTAICRGPSRNSCVEFDSREPSLFSLRIDKIEPPASKMVLMPVIILFVERTAGLAQLGPILEGIVKKYLIEEDRSRSAQEMPFKDRVKCISTVLLEDRYSDKRPQVDPELTQKIKSFFAVDISNVTPLRFNPSIARLVLDRDESCVVTLGEQSLMGQMHEAMGLRLRTDQTLIKKMIPFSSFMGWPGLVTAKPIASLYELLGILPGVVEEVMRRIGESDYWNETGRGNFFRLLTDHRLTPILREILQPQHPPKD